MSITFHETAGWLSIRKATAWLPMLILAIVIGGAASAKAEEKSLKNRIVVAELSEKALKKGYSYTWKSNSITPEKSPEEFWERFKEESKKKDFSSKTFIEKVTRGLTVKVKREHGKTDESGESSNPNYRITVRESFVTTWKLIFDPGKLCLPFAWVKKFCLWGEGCRLEDADKITYPAPDGHGGHYLFVSDEEDGGCIESIEYGVSGVLY